MKKNTIVRVCATALLSAAVLGVLSTVVEKNKPKDEEEETITV